MAGLTKRKKLGREKIEPTKTYQIDEALTLVKELANTKFSESIDVSVNLGVDPRKSDQVVRGSTILPNGTGKTVRVAVFAQGDNVDKAKAADIIWAATQYQRDRKEAYFHLNQFELQYDDMMDGGTRWDDAIQAIKEKYPKPE